MDRGQQTGFAGLQAYGTNIESALLAAEELAAVPPPVAPTPSPPIAPEPAPVQDREPGFLGAIPIGVKRLVAGAAGIALIIGVRACFVVGTRPVAGSGGSTTPYTTTDAPYDSSSPSYDTSGESNYNATVTAPSPTENLTIGSEDPSTSIPEDDGSEIDQPPLGSSGQTFTTAQVRYCLQEEVRISAARRHMESMPQDSVSTYDRAVRNFNSAIGDYNSRCSSYYSNSSVVAAAQASVDAARSRLEAEGVERLR